MSVVPAGPVSIATSGLATLIANVPWFQTWTGTDSPEDAADSVFVGEVGSPIESVAIAGGVMTIATRDEHGLTAPCQITMQGAAMGPQSSLGIEGLWTVAANTATTLSIDVDLADIGPLYPDQAFLFLGTRPLAVISPANDSLKSRSVGTSGANILYGTLDILLEADVSSSYVNDPINAGFEADNAYGQFVEGLMATQGTGDLMWLNTCDPVSPPQFVRRDEQDDNTNRFEKWRALVKVTWGLEG